MQDVLSIIKQTCVIPVIALDDASKAEPLAHALLEGGVPIAEITFRTNAAYESIKRISRQVPEVLVLAGTVLNTQQADMAIDAGAKCVIAPGFNIAVAEHCKEKGIMYIPGVATPSEMEGAMSLGLYTVKFFPAAQAGGIDYIKAVSAPYADLSFIPTGGITKENIIEYLKFPKVIACGASFIAAQELTDKGDFAEVKKRCENIRNLIAKG